MIDILINGQLVDITASFQMEMEYENPLFSETGFREGKSFTFSLDATPLNKTIITGTVSDFVLMVESVALVSGEAHVKKRNDRVILLQVVSSDSTERKKIENTKLSALSWPEIDVCSAVATSAKQATWKTFIDQNLQLHLYSNANQKIMCFPLIYTKGYREIDYSNLQIDDNVWMEANFNPVNYYAATGFVGNGAYPNTEARKIWATTIAPCIRIPYILEQVFGQLGLVITKNELEGIEEYQQMFAFNNYVMDLFETYGSSKVNNFGNVIKVVNHLPDTNALAALTLLQEVFDAYYIFDNNRVRIELASNSLGKPLVNLSKYLVDVDVDETDEKLIKKFVYPAEEKVKSRKNYTDWPTDYFLPLGDRYYPEESAEADDVNLEHVALHSGYNFQEGILDNYGFFQNYEGNNLTLNFKTAYGEFQSGVNGENYVVSNEFPDEENAIFENFRIGLYRGVARSAKTHPGTGTTYFDHAYTYSHKQLFYPNSGILGFTNMPEFGKSSIYHQGPDNSFDLYKKLKLDKANGKLRKERVYALPIFELRKLLDFKRHQHLIEQQTESFLGFVKTVKFTVTKSGISETRVEYLVDDKIENLSNKRQWITAK